MLFVEGIRVLGHLRFLFYTGHLPCSACLQVFKRVTQPGERRRTLNFLRQQVPGQRGTVTSVQELNTDQLQNTSLRSITRILFKGETGGLSAVIM